MSLKDPNAVRPRLPKRVAIILSNPAISPTTGWPEEAWCELPAGLWRGFVMRDGNLITGQQNFSGQETADLVIRALVE